jgi:hypothetical protein
MNFDLEERTMSEATTVNSKLACSSATAKAMPTLEIALNAIHMGHELKNGGTYEG